LAKLVAQNRPVWLLDEPFSGLDPLFRSEFRHDLLLFQASARATILLVTHDPIDALALGHRIGVLADGVLQQIGPPDELKTHPGNRFVAFCVGGFSFLDGTVERTGAGDGDPVAPAATQFVAEGGSVRVPVPPELFRRLGDPAPTRRLTLGLRIDDVQPRPPGLPSDSSSDGAITGWPLVSAEPDGSGWLLTVARGRTRLRVGWRSGSPPPVGAQTDWTIPAAHGTWFDGGTGERL
jgi:ABC-type sugar transport system ATPase subunit